MNSLPVTINITIPKHFDEEARELGEQLTFIIERAISNTLNTQIIQSRITMKGWTIQAIAPIEEDIQENFFINDQMEQLAINNQIQE